MTDITLYAPLWGSWHIDALIGEGSFGRVYKVRKEEFGKTYYAAVKIISIPQNEADLKHMRGEGMTDASVRSYYQAFVADIIQEIDLMSELRGNSNVVSFEDHKVIERTDGFGWDILIRMELLTSLTEKCMEKPLPPDEVVKLGIHICRALELCALKKTIHRDIKPDNIFVSAYGDYKLGDFGIARQIERTMSGLSKKGTYTYMAPEVFKGDDYGASVDTYSLGIVMYRLLNKNRTPFLPPFPQPILPNDRDASLQRRMRGEAIPAIDGVDPALNTIVLKACAFDRAERFSNATQMKRTLEEYARGERTMPLKSDVVQVVEPSIPEAEPEHTEATVGAFDAVEPERTEMTIGAFDGLPPNSADDDNKDAKDKRKNWFIWGVCIVLAVVLLAVFASLASETSNLGNGEEPAFTPITSSEYLQDLPWDPGLLPVETSTPTATEQRTTASEPTTTTKPTTSIRQTTTTQKPTTKETTTTALVHYVGENISFGGYEWKVLEISGDKALIFARKNLTDHQTKVTYGYDDYVSVTWEDSYARRWLNNDFYNQFSENDRSKILSTRLPPDSSGGNGTYDKVFFLSIDEVQKYFPSEAARSSYYSTYTWTLRKSGNSEVWPNGVPSVDYVGKISEKGYPVTYSCTIMPAMWIMIN